MPERLGPEDYPDDSQLPDEPGTYIKRPNGEYANIFDILKFERLTDEQRVSGSLLRQGDKLLLQHSEPDGPESDFVYSVEQTNWRNLGVSGSHCPALTLEGRLSGPGLTSEDAEMKAYFMGSGFGGSMLETGAVVTGRYPQFSLEDGRGVQIPPLTNFSILRPSTENGELRRLDSLEISVEATKQNESHQQRLAQAQILMRKFGFDNYDFTNTKVSSVDIQQVPFGQLSPDNSQSKYEDDRYLAEYSAHMAMGNSLAIFDKQTSTWMELKYYNYTDNDTLQIGFADLKGINIDDLFIGGINDESGIHRSGRGITTHVTSVALGISAINYRPSEQEAELMGIPRHPNYIARPDIQLFSDGQIRVPVEYPYTIDVEANPQLHDQVTSSIAFGTNDNGSRILNLSGQEITLPDPDIEINSILHHESGE